MNKVIIFGGSGFIGTHLSHFLIGNELTNRVFCVDIKEPRFQSEKVEYIRQDVRESIGININGIDTIYNLAAIHTTPGHPDGAYFETNILGAENICNFAEKRGIKTIVFTSSISPYGPSEELKKEEYMPRPVSAYGISKTIAEYIHRVWLAKSTDRKLVIVRPGVVFGYGEEGNFTQLYQSLKKRYFFYPGRKDTQKACVYVKDAVKALYEMSKSNERFQIYNMCYPESPAIETIVKTIADITKVSNGSLVIPGGILKFVAGTISLMIGMCGRQSKFHPDRVKKLMLSTNISGEKLQNSPYALRFSLKEAIEDWYHDCNYQGLF